MFVINDSLVDIRVDTQWVPFHTSPTHSHPLTFELEFLLVSREKWGRGDTLSVMGEIISIKDQLQLKLFSKKVNICRTT